MNSWLFLVSASKLSGVGGMLFPEFVLHVMRYAITA